MRGFFITGTDTDAGKSVVAAALMRYFLDQKSDVAYMKPVQTGVVLDNGEYSLYDLDFISRLAGYSYDKSELEMMVPYALKKPCSPHLASAIDSVPIVMDKIVTAFRTISSVHKLLLVEGAGGLMVPLNDKVMMLDLIKKLKLPVIIASHAGLGTINHTLLTINTLKRDEVNIAGVIYSHTKREESPDYIVKDNIKTVSEISGVKTIGVIPFLGDLTTLDSAEFTKKVREINFRL